MRFIHWIVVIGYAWLVATCGFIGLAMVALHILILFLAIAAHKKDAS